MNRQWPWFAEKINEFNKMSQFPKLSVEGSIPFARSNVFNNSNFSSRACCTICVPGCTNRHLLSLLLIQGARSVSHFPFQDSGCGEASLIHLLCVVLEPSCAIGP
jgi:hypothetical protein